MGNGYTPEQMIDKVYDELKEFRKDFRNYSDKVDTRIDKLDKDNIKDHNSIKEETQSKITDLSNKLNESKHSIIVSIIVAIPSIAGAVWGLIKFFGS